eukprot:366059-Chlamydomonas_euryale.AAC.2
MPSVASAAQTAAATQAECQMPRVASAVLTAAAAQAVCQLLRVRHAAARCATRVAFACACVKLYVNFMDGWMNILDEPPGLCRTPDPPTSPTSLPSFPRFLTLDFEWMGGQPSTAMRISPFPQRGHDWGRATLDSCELRPRLSSGGMIGGPKWLLSSAGQETQQPITCPGEGAGPY